MRYNLVAFLNDTLTTRHPPTNEKDRKKNSEGCTTWAATGSATIDSQPILAKTRDYRLEHLPLQIVVQAEPIDGYRYTYINQRG